MSRLCLIAAGVAALLVAALLAACATTRTAVEPRGSEALARGGRLYDNWITETAAAAPDAAHPLYPPSGEYATKPGANWRCKECHGWDYRGKEGAYASGKHASGIAGIRGAAGTDVNALARALASGPHDFAGKMSDADLRDVALFVSRGQLDMTVDIDAGSLRARGDAPRGASYFATLCAGCHGAEGIVDDMPVLGTVARSNPWETLHKILNGQPGSAMPALRSLDRQVALDVLAHVQTLPDKP